MRRLALPLLLMLAGCAPPATISPPAPTIARPSTDAAAPSPTPRPPSPTAGPTAPACMALPGQVLAEEIEAEGMSRSLPYRVYLPPCFDPAAGVDYPVLVLIHGLQSTDSQWDDLGADETADGLIRAGRLEPVVIVMPWERKGLDFEAAIVDVLLPHIRSTYAGDGDRSTTAIGGLSRGAGWALRIGLRHPDVFGAIGLHSPAVLPPDMYYVPEWVESARQGIGVPRLWIDVATRDTSRAGAEELTNLLESLGLTFAWSSAPGEHSAPYWSSRMKDYLAWYGEPWGRDVGGMERGSP